MHVIRKFVAAMMAVSLLLVSTVPTVSAAVCDLPGMGGVTDNIQIEPAMVQTDLADCYIECGCRIDNHIDGMPHQLAPHALSSDTASVASDLNHAIAFATPALSSRWLSFPPPPPRSI